VIALDVKAVTKAEMLEKYIVKEILPQYKPDTKIPSELVMAKELRTSRTTVHKIFSNLTAKGLLYRENGLGTFVSKPKPKTPKTKIITAVCSSDSWHDPSRHASWFNTQFLLEGFSHAMHNHDYLFNILYIHPDEQSLEKGLQIMLDTKADGFLFPGLGGYDRYIAKLTEQGKPCAVRTSKRFSGCNSIWGVLDDGFYDAMNYLLEHGKKNIAFLGYAKIDDSFTTKKITGVLRAMEKHNMSEDKLTRIVVDDSFEMDGYRAVTKLLAKNKNIDAILSSTDRLAFGALEAIKDAGLRIPEDIAIIGSDDLPKCKDMNPPLASITYPLYEMGEAMFKVLDKALNNPEMKLVHQDIKCVFVPKESCGFINNKT